MSERSLDCETLISIDGSGFWDHHLFILSVSRRSKKFGMDIRDISECVLDLGFFVDDCYEAPSHSVGGVDVAVEVWIPVIPVTSYCIYELSSWSHQWVIHSDDTCTRWYVTCAQVTHLSATVALRRLARPVVRRCLLPWRRLEVAPSLDRQLLMQQCHRQ